MSVQIDWIGAVDGRPQFKDIRNQRASVAETKAQRVLELGRLIAAIPPHIKSGGSVNAVREWREARASAAKIAGSSRSSIAEITSAISNMGRFLSVSSEVFGS